jgi:hypothetical protein
MTIQCKEILRSLYLACKLLFRGSFRRQVNVNPHSLHRTLPSRKYVLGLSVIYSCLKRCSNMEFPKSSIFCDIAPCSRLKVSHSFGGTCRFHLQIRRISQARNQREAGIKQSLAYSSILKMEATYSSETSVGFQRTTRCYIPELL